MKSVKITKNNHAGPFKNPEEAVTVRGKFFNDLIDDLFAHVPSDGHANLDHIGEYTEGEGVEIIGERKDIGYSDGNVSLTSQESGKTFFIDGSSSASTYTLPAPRAGLNYKWIWGANCDAETKITTADHTDTTGDMLRGGLLVCSAAAVNTFIEASGDMNTLSVDDNVDNKAAGAGSWIEIYCVRDAEWLVTGVLNGNTDADGNGSVVFSDVD